MAGFHVLVVVVLVALLAVLHLIQWAVGRASEPGEGAPPDDLSLQNAGGRDPWTAHLPFVRSRPRRLPGRRLFSDACSGERAATLPDRRGH